MPNRPHIHTEDISHLSELTLCQHLAERPYFFYLDSADPESEDSCYSFMGADPFMRISVSHQSVRVYKNGFEQVVTQNPWDVISFYLAQYTFPIHVDGIPIWGGAVGYIAYEAHRFCQPLSAFSIPPVQSNSDPIVTQIPVISLAFFNKIIVINKKNNQKTYVCADFENKKTTHSFAADFGDITHSAPTTSPIPFQMESPIDYSINKATYLSKIKTILNHIYEGDIYQANFSYRGTAQFSGNLLDLYTQLRHISPAPYGGFMRFGDTTILSSSPEKFIKIQGRKITTRPIKGTLRRGKTPEEDTLLRNQLLNSSKDRAELTMIIDLERNDLGTICEYNSIHVPELIAIEQYAQVFHLVSTIEGILKKGLPHPEALRRIFPGGSITGAPKIRAMQILEGLETVPRGIYTGCIGYFGFNEVSEWNIAIRTIYTHHSQLYFHTGGGIVANSTPESEWEETRLKAKGILTALNPQSIRNFWH